KNIFVLKERWRHNISTAIIQHVEKCITDRNLFGQGPLLLELASFQPVDLRFNGPFYNKLKQYLHENAHNLDVMFASVLLLTKRIARYQYHEKKAYEGFQKGAL